MSADVIRTGPMSQVQTHHPTANASVVRFSSPPPTGQARGHHIVDVDIETSASELSYGPDIDFKPSFQKRVHRFIRRVLEEVWTDLLFFRLPAMYQERTSQAALRCRSRSLRRRKEQAKGLMRTRARSSHFQGAENGLGDLGDIETEIETETELDHADTGKQGYMSNGHGASRESVNAFAELDWNDRGLWSEWGSLVSDLLQEWKTMGIGASLLLIASLILLQLTPADIVTRTGCLFSFICAAISLLGAMVCMVRFSGMRMEGKAIALMQKSLDNNHVIWWNFWIALAAPLTWFLWALILLIASAMTFTWRSTAGSLTSLGASPTEIILPLRVLLGIRIGASALLGMGVLSIVMMLVTLDRIREQEAVSQPQFNLHTLGRRVGRGGPARVRRDSHSSDDHHQLISRTREPVAMATIPHPAQPRRDSEPRLAFPRLASASITEIHNVSNPFPVSSPEPQSSSPRVPLSPYLSSGSDTNLPAHPSHSDPSLPARIEQLQGKGKRTISTSQLVGVPVVSSSDQSSSSRANNRSSRAAPVGGKSTGSSSGAGKRISQDGQRHSASRKGSAASVSRPKRHSRANSTPQGKTSLSGKR